MTPRLRRRSMRIAAIACAVSTTSCAAFRPLSPGATPPRIEIPVEAARPCALPRLDDDADLAALEAAYARRGAALVACDAARRLALDAWAAERSLVERWLRGE